MNEKPRFKKRETNYRVQFFDYGKWWMYDCFGGTKSGALMFRDYQRNTLGRKAVVVKETITREIVPDDPEPQGET